MRLTHCFTLAAFAALFCPLAGSSAPTLTTYDCWGNLGFEDTPPVNINHWSANSTAVSFVDDATQAHAGRGALKIEGTSQVSVWGSRVAGEIIPQTGQSIGGFFWIKLLSTPDASASVDVRMTGHIGTTETIYCHTAAINLSSLPLNTWVKVDLAPDGNTFLADSDINFSIVSDGGVNCLVDDITFGSPGNPLPPLKTLLRQTHTVPASDPAIRYAGRWSNEGGGKRGNWIRPYFKLSFSRSTAVGINLLQPASLTIVLDGVATTYQSVNGPVTLGANLSPSEVHTLQVSGLTWQDSVIFDGIQLEDTARLHDTAVRRNHIEFIGDSITAWDNGYSWAVPEKLGAESSRIAWPGIALRDGFGYYKPRPAGAKPVGMASAYFQNGMPGYGTAGNWNFTASPYTPNLVVINLGTNDFSAIQGNPAQVAAFQSSYQTLIKNVRAKCPVAEIFILRPFTISAADVQTAIQSAAQAVIDAGDKHVHYVNTSTWGVAIGNDGIHPSSAGHTTITNRLVALLTPHLRGETRP